MIVKAIYKDKNFNYFRDVETNDKRMFGDIFECDDTLAEERILKGLVKKASKKEESEYLAKKEIIVEYEQQKSVVSNEEKETENKDLTSDLEKDKKLEDNDKDK